MKALTKLTVALLTAVLVGCVSSVNPLFTEGDLIFNSDLLGKWSDGESQLFFISEDENAYTLISSDEGEAFKTYLLKLDNTTFLDIYPLDTLSENYLFQATHFPVHTFFRIEIEKEQIVISEINSELLDSLINDNRLDIPYVQSQEGRLLLTASTIVLQNFVQENEDLFTNPVIFEKENR